MSFCNDLLSGTPPKAGGANAPIVRKRRATGPRRRGSNIEGASLSPCSRVSVLPVFYPNFNNGRSVAVCQGPSRPPAMTSRGRVPGTTMQPENRLVKSLGSIGTRRHPMVSDGMADAGGDGRIGAFVSPRLLGWDFDRVPDRAMHDRGGWNVPRDGGWHHVPGTMDPTHCRNVHSPEPSACPLRQPVLAVVHGVRRPEPLPVGPDTVVFDGTDSRETRRTVMQ